MQGQSESCAIVGYADSRQPRLRLPLVCPRSPMQRHSAIYAGVVQREPPPYEADGKQGGNSEDEQIVYTTGGNQSPEPEGQQAIKCHQQNRADQRHNPHR